MMSSFPCLPVELQDEIFSIAARDLFEISDYRSLLDLSLVDRRRHHDLQALIHSRYAAPSDGYYKSQGISSPPDTVLTNNAVLVGKHVHNFLWHITSEQHTVFARSEPPFMVQMENVEVFTLLITEYLSPATRHYLIRSIRRWPVKRLELMLRIQMAQIQSYWNAYSYLFNRITDVYDFPPSRWNLTHLSIGVDDMSYFAFPPKILFLDVTPSPESGLGSLTHLRVCFHPRVEELEEVDWEMLFANHPLIQIVVLQFVVGWRPDGIAFLPQNEPRLVCALSGEQHPLGMTLWDGRGGDMWFKAEQIRDQRLSYLEQLALTCN